MRNTSLHINVSCCVVIAVLGSAATLCAQDLRPQSADTSSGLENELEAVLQKAVNRVVLGPAWARPPDTSDRDRFSFFVEHNKSRWNLQIDAPNVPPGTVYEQTVTTEEGGVVSEFLVFGDHGEVTWWYDGRRDPFPEFSDPSVRKMRVPKIYLAMHDGKSGWVEIKKEGEMPLDSGLGIGIELQDGSSRYW